MAKPLEIPGGLSNIETIAAGTGIREVRACTVLTGEAAGASAKASPKFDCRMAQFVKLSYIGMRQAESGGVNSRSNTCSNGVKIND